MGVKIFDIVPTTPITLDDLKGRTIVIDGNLVLYQFLTTIRQPDGAPLTDSQGNVTSHLQGLFARTTNLMQRGIKLAFVFDGKAPDLKRKEQEKRAQAKAKAQESFDAAQRQQDIELMKKYAGRSARLDKEMIAQAQELLGYLGLPIVQAPAEGEAQAARIVADGNAYAVGTQDADVFMFGAPRLVKNLTLSEKRKAPGRLGAVPINPERLELQEALERLDLSFDQLIALCMLVGTDFNRGGIPGIGAKKALKLIKAHPRLPDLFAQVSFDEVCGVSWQEVFDTIKGMPTCEYTLSWRSPDKERVLGLLCDRFEFSRERVSAVMDKLAPGSQQGLGRWV